MSAEGIEATDSCFGCRQCETLTDVNERFVDTVRSLFTRQGGMKSMKATCISDAVASALSMCDARKSYHLLHEHDLAKWQKLVRALQKSESTKFSTLKEEVLPILRLQEWAAPFPSANAETNLRERLLVKDVFSFFAPTRCEQHQKPCIATLFEQYEDVQLDVAPSIPQLSSRIVLVEAGIYKSMISHLIALMLLLQPINEKESLEFLRRTHLDLISDAEDICQKYDCWSLHPLCAAMPIGYRSKGDIFQMTSDGMSVRFVLKPSPCANPDCMKTFDDWRQTLKATYSNDPPGETFSVKTESVAGSAAGAPIVVDSDIDDDESLEKFTCRVFELTCDADLSKAIPVLCECAGLPKETVDAGGNGLRRSSRKRKTRYPVGDVVDEDSVQMSLGNNIAAVRLSLLERCTSGSDYDLSHDLKLLVLPPPLQSLDDEVAIDEDAQSNEKKLRCAPHIVPLTFEMNDQTLREVCENVLSVKLNSSFKPSQGILIVRQSKADSSTDGLTSDAIMDHLISISNTTSPSKNSNAGSQKTKPKAKEKGFSGTLLSSAPARSPSLDYAENGTGAGKTEVKDIENSKSAPMDDDNPSSGQQSTTAAADTKQREEDSNTVQGNDKRTDDHALPLANSKHHVPAKKSSGGNRANGKRDILQVLESEDEQDVLLFGASFATSSRKRQDSSLRRKLSKEGDSSREKNKDKQTDRDDIEKPSLILSVVELLMQNYEVDKSKEGLLYDAAEWAVGDNQNESDASKLVDIAFAKYVEQAFC